MNFFILPVVILSVLYLAGFGYTQTLKDTTMTTENTVKIDESKTKVKPKPDGSTQAPVNKYQYEENGKVCMLVQMAAKLNFTYNETYTNGSHTTSKLKEIQWNIPKNATVNNSTSSCGNKGHLQWLVITFFEEWYLNMTIKNNSDKTFKVNDVFLTYTADNMRFPGIATKDQSHRVTTHSSDLGFQWYSATCFECHTKQSLDGFNHTNYDLPVLNNILTTDVRIEAFRDKDDAAFRQSVTSCVDDIMTSPIIPIAIGSALAGLIVVILVTYLIIRKKSQKGYGHL